MRPAASTACVYAYACAYVYAYELIVPSYSQDSGQARF